MATGVPGPARPPSDRARSRDWGNRPRVSRSEKIFARTRGPSRSSRGSRHSRSRAAPRVARGRRVHSARALARGVAPRMPPPPPPGPPPPGKREKRPFRERTLLCFVQALQGMRVVVEMRDDIAIRGTLADVDDRMNCVLENAQRRDPEGALLKLERVYVSARLIRYIHIPPDVDPSELVERKRLEAFEASRHYQRKAAFGPRNPSKAERAEAEAEAGPGGGGGARGARGS